MNKIISINIGGLAIMIEEDAYDVLRTYLKSITDHFKNVENGQEIIEDIEQRIAEMLQERLKPGKAAIDINDIEEVRERMGNPGQFETGEEEPEDTADDTSSESEQAQRVHRRLYRDPDSGLLGGVCAGLSNYLGIDITIIRILWVIFAFVFGTSVFLYLILWIIVPEATTTSEKLEMMGEEPNIDNIRKKIREEANAAMDSIRKTARREDIKRAVRRGGAFVEGLGRTIARGGGGILSILILVLLVFLTIRVLFGVDNVLIRIPNFSRESLSMTFESPTMFWVLISSFYATIAIPLFLILTSTLRFVFGLEKNTYGISRALKWVWFASIAILIILGSYTAAAFSRQATVDDEVQLPYTDTLFVEMSDETMERVVSTRKRPELLFRQSSTDDITLTHSRNSNGFTEEDAEQLADDIVPAFRTEGNKLYITKYVYLRKDGQYRNQKVKITLNIPEGTVVQMGGKIARIFDDYNSSIRHAPKQVNGGTFQMRDGRLVCISCEDSEYPPLGSAVRQSQRFDVIAVENAFMIEINEGDRDEVSVDGPAELVDDISTTISNGILNIRYTGSSWENFKRLMRSESVNISVTARNIRRLESDGASQFEIYGMRTDKELFITLDGASSIKARGVYAPEVHIDMDGASTISITGKCDQLNVVSDGANSLYAKDLRSKRVSLDIDGASSCEIYAEDLITGSVEGASSIKYYGSPSMEASFEGVVKVKKM